MTTHVTTVSITPEDMQFMKEQHISPSMFLRTKLKELREELKEEAQKEQAENYLKEEV